MNIPRFHLRLFLNIFPFRRHHNFLLHQSLVAAMRVVCEGCHSGVTVVSHVRHPGPHGNSVAAALTGWPRVEAVLVRRQVELSGLTGSVSGPSPGPRGPHGGPGPRGLWLVNCRGWPGPCGQPVVDWTSVIAVVATIGNSIGHPIVFSIS